MTYRREIDGLRAAAVVPVILFHAGFSWFSGGYVGVDVFFVISGYLITGIILAERAAGRFSLAGFYERRARRILPALFVVMAACLPFAWLWMLPEDLNDFFQSVVAVSVFASNFLFWSKSDYFATAAEATPLLHTWSLAVEEQFYLLFPLMVMLLWRVARRHLFGVLAATAILSLALAQWQSAAAPETAFYLLHTRAWELLIGALISLHRFEKPAHSIPKAIEQFAGVLGLALIAYAIFAFDQRTPFPSIYALVPTIGTALLILFATPQTLAGRVLGHRWLVGIGLISYSAYLWHQPLFAFARLRSLDSPGETTFGVLALVALVLAYLTWRFVERPFRDRTRMSRKTIFRWAAAASLAMLAIGGFGDHTDGFVESYVARLSPEQKEIYSYIDYEYEPVYRTRECFLVAKQGPEDFAAGCAPETAPDPDAVILWGDSHAASLSSGLWEEYPDSLSQFTASGCAPVTEFTFPTRPNCAAINEHVMTEIARIQPRIVLLQANWREYEPLGALGGLERTIDRMRKEAPSSSIIVIGGLPQWEPNLPLSLIRRRITPSKDATIPTPLLADLARIDAELEKITAKSGARFISALSELCTAENCLAFAESDRGVEPIAWDYGHLTAAGSAALAAKLVPRINAPQYP